MALHTDLKIYKTGTSLLALAFNVQKNMERGYKRGIGEQITALCTDMLVLKSAPSRPGRYSHQAQAKVINALRERGYNFAPDLTKIFRKKP